jgi:hypothetical protein
VAYSRNDFADQRASCLSVNAKRNESAETGRR